MFGLDSEDPFLQAAATSTKRVKLDASEEPPQRKTCKHGENCVFDQSHPAIDVLICSDFIDQTCECSDCQSAFAKIKRLLDALDNRDEDEIKLENNLEGEVNQEQDPQTAITEPEVSGRQAFIYLFEKHFQAIIDRKFREVGHLMTPDSAQYVQSQLDLMRDKVNAFYDTIEARRENGTKEVVVTAEDVHVLF